MDEMINLYALYIQAWSNYEEDKVMEMLKRYMNKPLKELCWSAWSDIQYFHKNYSIHAGHYYEVEEDYAIGNNEGEVIWKGDYPTEEIIKWVIYEA